MKMSNTTVKSPTAVSSKATNGNKRAKEEEKSNAVVPAAPISIWDSLKSLTSIIISRYGPGFDAELVSKAIKSIKESPFRGVYLRVAHQETPDKPYVQFNNEMFGRSKEETYVELIDDIIGYDGNDVQSFSLTMGYNNVHVNPAKKEHFEKIRTNINGEVRYLKKHGLIAMSNATGEHPYVEEVKQSSSGVTLHKSNAVFQSKHSYCVAKKPTPAELEMALAANPHDRLSYENRRIVEFLYAIQKGADVSKMNLSWLDEDDMQPEVVYVIPLDDCKIRINSKETKPNSMERLKAMFFAIQSYLRNLNSKQINIVNKLQDTTEGKKKIVGFNWAFLPPEKDDGGRVIVSDPIGPERCYISPNVFHDRLRGFWGYKPTDDEIFETMKSFLDTYGYELNEENITFSTPDASNDTSTAASAPQSKTSQFFAKKQDASAQPAAAAAASSTTAQYRGRGRGYGRGNQ
jgi:hypothetical protein